MTWAWPHRMLTCYGLLPIVHEWPLPPLLEACSPWRYPQCEAIAARRGYRLTVCDIAPRVAGCEAQDLTALTYKDGAFRGAISCDTLEHLDDMAAGLAELYRVTAAGGFLILCLPVCHLGGGQKRQQTDAAPAGDVMHHKWRPGMDFEATTVDAGYRVIGTTASRYHSRWSASAIWIAEKPE